MANFLIQDGSDLLIQDSSVLLMNDVASGGSGQFGSVFAGVVRLVLLTVGLSLLVA